VKQPRSPVRISAKQVVDLMKSGMDDAGLMEKFNLSAKALHSLMEQLIEAGAVRPGEVNQRGSLSPESVVMNTTEFGMPELSRGKPVINAADAINCIRSGMSDSSLMKRYSISARGLRSLFGKLVASGAIEQDELDRRFSETQNWVVVER
jgi:hypothetical protein